MNSSVLFIRGYSLKRAVVRSDEESSKIPETESEKGTNGDDVNHRDEDNSRPSGEKDQDPTDEIDEKAPIESSVGREDETKKEIPS